MTKEQVLLNKSQKALSMLFNAPTNTKEAVQQYKDVVMRAWRQIHNAMIEYEPSLTEWEALAKEQVYKFNNTWTWDKEMYLYATNVFWSENTQFMKGIIDRFMHIDKNTFIEYYGRPYEMPFSFEKEYDPSKFVGTIIKHK